MASSPIISWQIEGRKVEAMTDFIFLVSKITEDGDCSHEMKTLAPWKKSYDKPRQCVKKRRQYFADKDLYSQSYVRAGPYRRMSTKELRLSNCGAGEDS